MLKICTVYHKGFYTPDYVGKFYRALKRNSTINFQRVCISEDPNVEADWVFPLNPHSNIKYHWHKLTFFSPLFGYQNPEDEIIVMDIDQVIVGNVDQIIGHPVGDNELVSYNKWWGKDGGYRYRGPSLNGGFYNLNQDIVK